MRVGRVRLHKFFGVTDGQWAQQKRVHHTEDGRVDAQTESNGEECNNGKAGIFYQHPKSKT
jgi:hypothetical protein